MSRRGPLGAVDQVVVETGAVGLSAGSGVVALAEQDGARKLGAMVEARLATLRALPQPTRTRAQRLRIATVRYGVRQLDAELAWIDETEGAL